MSHTLTINQDLGVIVLRAKQPFSYQEICAVLDELVRLPGFREGLVLVADFRGSGTQLIGEDMRQLAIRAQGTDVNWGDTKWAILASSDLMYGLSRMFVAHTREHHVETQVFRGSGEAGYWLGLGVKMEEILARTPEA